MEITKNNSTVKTKKVKTEYIMFLEEEFDGYKWEEIMNPYSNSWPFDKKDQAAALKMAENMIAAWNKDKIPGEADYRTLINVMCRTTTVVDKEIK